MMPTQAPTPAPIHDIAGPVPITSIPLEWTVGGAIGIILLVLLAVWLFSRKKNKRPLTPTERALAALSALKQEGVTSDSYAFGVKASDILRTYIRDEHGLDAVTKTSLEFLDSLRNNDVFNVNEKASLAAFLETIDLLKYARAQAGPEDIERLFETARQLIEAKSSTTREAAKVA